jgi:hypothetical protein
MYKGPFMGSSHAATIAIAIAPKLATNALSFHVGILAVAPRAPVATIVPRATRARSLIETLSVLAAAYTAAG